MADNKPALFPITAFIVSYHYARSDGLCVTRVTVYDLFIAAPPSPPCAPAEMRFTRLHRSTSSSPPIPLFPYLSSHSSAPARPFHSPFHLPAACRKCAANISAFLRFVEMESFEWTVCNLRARSRLLRSAG